MLEPRLIFLAGLLATLAALTLRGRDRTGLLGHPLLVAPAVGLLLGDAGLGWIVGVALCPWAELKVAGVTDGF